ncbi:VQ motif-containing protein 17 [Vigna radiata var. radiata]|uniref:VQ motif-containing protein 17 n=1 Tax=Vigna radiata var. radiata TaxID=3916 RepID=A0A1S3V4S8_VIGRR|nr:VQ motif-containing protein 17 [Vigna radiata var. radiata]
MENMMRLRKHNSHTASLGMHKDSHMVSKSKPKIRIIHIFAPEIIKTDVENFRELVQKLTGKPSGEKCCKKKKTRAKREEEISRSSSSTGGSGMSEYHDTVITMKNNNGGCWGLDVTREKVKEEVGVCSSDESSAGYLGGFTDLEGFISEIGAFPFLPLDANQMMQGFEAPQLL